MNTDMRWRSFKRQRIFFDIMFLLVWVFTLYVPGKMSMRTLNHYLMR